MSNLTYALVTPSFRLDLAQCRLLVESVERHVPQEIRHYLVVDRRDVPLFRPLAGRRTEILTVEDIVPGWIVRIPGVRRFWWSWRSRPIKNWILQQIVKLSVADVVREDVFLFVDSDVLFVAPYDPRALERDGAVPLFVETGKAGIIPFNDAWHGVAAELIGLPAQKTYDTNFIGNVICWRRNTVKQLHARMAEVARRDWVLAVAPKMKFSEYILYGLYVTQLMKGTAGHYDDPVDRTLCYWHESALSLQGLQELRARLEPKHHSVMISAKARTSADDIRRVFLAG